MDFSGKCVLVTGASRGIGRAVALAFARHGARVAVHYGQNQTAAQATLDQLDGGPHTLIQADLRDPAAVQRMVAATIATLGGLHVLVNNAGIFTEHKVAEADYDTWQRTWADVVNTNLIGAANALYWAAQHMQTSGGGHIINVSSRGAFRGEPDAPAYGASKAGMNAMSQSMALALAPHGIYVTAVAPGWVETDMAADYLEGETGAKIKAQSPLNRVASVEEVAHLVLYLATPEAAFMTGAVVDINGASYLRT